MATADRVQHNESYGTVIESPVTEELASSFLEYAMSVIVARALPDARDGLKPVHRRILYGLYDRRLWPNVSYVKCAKVTGHVMGDYHPHGDSAIYDALVRMSQDFSMRLPLVDGHGNFGSLGGDDPPAAQRYTECRMAPGAVAMIEEIGEDTVEFTDSYDGKTREPTVLPAAFPNLLVNGSQGIAVGMATNIPPHNLDEIVAACRLLLDNPKVSDEKLFEQVKGPDLPCGGTIVGLEGVREAYRTGRGSFRMRASAEITDVSPRRRGIVITELPYGVGTEKIVAKIKDLVGDKKLVGISDVKDLSDRKRGLHLVIECKTGFDPRAVLFELYRSTALEESFGVNAVALVDGQPRVLTLRQMLELYVAHRLDVVRRRTEHRLGKARARAHIVEGLLIALRAIDDVVGILKGSKDTDTARGRLRRQLKLTETQADHILEMPLRRLTGLEVRKLDGERKELAGAITGFEKILATPKRLAAQVSGELAEAAERLGTPRRTRLLEHADEPEVSDVEIADEPCVVAVGADGTLSRREVDAPRAAKPARGELVRLSCVANTRSQVAAITDQGRWLTLPVAEVPAAAAGRAKGVGVEEFFDLDAGESIVALVPRDVEGLALVTSGGVVKRLVRDGLPTRDGQSLISLRDDDRVVGVVVVDRNGLDLVLVSSSAQLMRTALDSVRPQGRSAGGVAGMRLGEGARVIAVGVVADGDEDVEVVTVSDGDEQSVKRTRAVDYPVKGRGGAGVRCQTFRKAERELAHARIAVGPSYLVGPRGDGRVVDAPYGRRDGSGNKLDRSVASIAGRA